MENKQSLKEKVIIVTGGTGVLGNSFIEGIAEAGGIVGILGRNEKVASERAASIIDKGGKAIALKADVLNTEDLIVAKNKVLQQVG